MSIQSGPSVLNQFVPDFLIDSTPTNGQFLVYDDTVQAFVNSTNPRIVLDSSNILDGSITIDKLAISGNKVPGYVLTITSAGGMAFLPVPGSGRQLPSLGELLDTNIVSPTVTQYLKWDGSAWVNSNITLNDVSDVSVISPTADDVLAWESGSWTNKKIDYTSLTNKPDLSDVVRSSELSSVAFSGDYNDLVNIPSATSNTIVGLTDVNDTALPNGFLRWNASGDEVEFITSISATVITGLAPVATSGNYNDLLGKPNLSVYPLRTEFSTVATTGNYSDLNNVPLTFAPSAHTHPAAQITGLASVATSNDYNDLVNKPTAMAPTAHTHAISDIIGLQNSLDSKLTVNLTTRLPKDVIYFNGTSWINKQLSYTDISGTPNLDNYVTDSELSTVATTGRYSDLINKPELVENLNDLLDVDVSSKQTGNVLTWNGTAWVASAITQASIDWANISNKPSVFSPAAHTHDVVDVLGLQSLLDSKLDANIAFDGDYNSLTNKPGLIDLQDTFSPAVPNGFLRWNNLGTLVAYQDYIYPQDISGLSDVAISGQYSDLLGTPSLSTVAITGSYSDLIDAPPAFDGDYDSLTNKPFIPTNFDFKFIGLNDVSPTVQPGGYLKWNLDGSFVVSSANIPATDVAGLSVVSTTGQYSDLLGKPLLATVSSSGSYTDLINIPTEFNPAEHTHNIADVSGLQASLDNKLNTSDAFSGDYNDLTNAPTNSSYSLVGLSDTNSVPVANGFLRWNASGSSVEYIQTIPVNAITGLAPVASSGQYADLQGTPDLSDYVLSVSLADIATTGEYSDLINAPDLSVYANKTDLSDVATTGQYSDLLGIPTQFTPTVHVHNVSQISGLATVATSGSYDDLSNKPSFANVATTGSYDDLNNKPSIPTNGSFSLLGLNDTNNTPVADGILRWNSSANQVIYANTIDAQSVSGLATVATIGKLSSLSDVDLIGLNQNEILQWNGSAWVPVPYNPNQIQAYIESGNTKVSTNDILDSIVLTAGPTTGNIIFELGNTNSSIILNPVANNVDALISSTSRIKLDSSTGISLGNISYPMTDGTVGQAVVTNGAGQLSFETVVKPSQLATVATSGNYNDLTNKPTLVTELNGLADVRMRDTNGNYLAQPEDVLTYSNGIWQARPNTSSSFIGLSDTQNITLPEDRANAYLRWDTTGNLIIYEDSISASVIAGLAEVATTGDLHDLINVNVNLPDMNNPATQAVWGLIWDRQNQRWINYNLRNIAGSGGSTVVALNDLTDVTLTFPVVDGNVLRATVQPDNSIVWQNKQLSYSDLTGTISMSLLQLTDTSSSAVPNGFLRWDSSGSTVQYITTISTNDITGLAPVATSGNYNDLSNKPAIPASINDLADVNTVNPVPTNGYVLTWDSSSNNWIAKEPATNPSGSTALADLTDVSLSDLAASDVLKYNGTTWVNEPVTYSELTDLPTFALVAFSGDYNDLTNKPSGSTTSILDLTDTADTALPNGFLRWNASGDEVLYQSSIDVSDIIGLSGVAISGDYNDLSNKPENNSYYFRKLADAGNPQPNTFIKYPAFTIPPGSDIDDVNPILEYVSSINALTDIDNLAPVATNGILGSLVDVNLNSVEDGQVLTYDAVTNSWINKNSSGSPVVTSWTKINGNYTVTGSEYLLVDTTSASVTITLPVAPTENMVIRIADWKGTFRTNSCVVNTNGMPLMGASMDNTLTIQNQNASIELTFVDTTYGWKITDGIGEISKQNIPVTNWRTVDSSSTPAMLIAQPGEAIYVNTNNGAVTVKLPTGASVNAVVRIADLLGTYDKASCFVDGNGNPIMGKNEILEIANENASIEFTYVDSVVGWKVTDGIGELGRKTDIASDSDIIVYVATDGNDTTGSGTEESPFATLNAAFLSLDGKFVNSSAEIIVRVAEGVYEPTNPVAFSHIQGMNVKLIGELPQASSSFTVTNITNDAGLAKVTMQLSSVSDYEVGDIIKITSAATMLECVEIITAINTGSNTLEIVIPNSVLADVSDYTGYTGTISKFTTVFKNTNMYVAGGYSLGFIDNIALVDDTGLGTALTVGRTYTTGIYDGPAYVGLGANFAVYGYETAIQSIPGSSVVLAGNLCRQAGAAIRADGSILSFNAGQSVYIANQAQDGIVLKHGSKLIHNDDASQSFVFVIFNNIKSGTILSLDTSISTANFEVKNSEGIMIAATRHSTVDARSAIVSGTITGDLEVNATGMSVISINEPADSTDIPLAVVCNPAYGSNIELQKGYIGL
ncbi:structural protein [Pseudomonas phage vB_PaeM_PA5oct]|uniref:Structural protein n=1 Tax=Pseudomonas phage vB_PaeM_PA5oct TaxID=2163605 RepID=A0A4Y5JVT5_9CAUD|nr:tail protein [Pseudomonas phage vB_PaeM_PA5oct]QCG76181.1 structural protein [Pseudomonas phage vB_PaeM_PA5oct]